MAGALRFHATRLFAVVFHEFGEAVEQFRGVVCNVSSNGIFIDTALHKAGNVRSILGTVCGKLHQNKSFGRDDVHLSNFNDRKLIKKTRKSRGDSQKVDVAHLDTIF